MHVGLYHEPIHTDGRRYDTYGAFARMALELARQCARVTVFAPCTDQPTYFSGVPLDAPNLEVAPLPFFMTHAEAYRHAPRLIRVFRQHAARLDAVLVRSTAPLAYVLWYFTRPGVPFIYHFTADPFEVIARSPKYTGPRRLLARSVYGIEFAIQKFIINRNFAFTSGRALWERVCAWTPRADWAVDSSLAEDDYYLRDDSCRRAVIRLLYVGYLRHGKGLDDIIAAAAMLRAQGRPVEVELVGSGEEEPALRAQVDALGLREYVHFRGHATLGPELNGHYDRSDIFVFPSLSEGSPRVVLEALGHSLPVVATPVGNIAEMLGEGRRGVLVPCQDRPALAAGICRIIDDAEFRRQCIREGYAWARERSLAAFIGKIVGRLREMRGQSRAVPPAGPQDCPG